MAKSVTDGYIEEMKQPLRKPTLMEIYATPRDKVQGLLKDSEIQIPSEYLKSVDIDFDVDPISRRLPVHRINFSIIDYKREIFDKPIWQTKQLIEISARFVQTLEDDTLEKLTPDTFYFKSITHEHDITKIQAIGFFDLADTVVAVGRNVASGDLIESVNKDLSYWFEDVYGIQVDAIFTDPNVLRIPAYIPMSTCAKQWQILANSLGASLQVANNYSFTNVFITPVEFRKASPTDRNTISIRDCLKNSITLSKSPKVKSIRAKLPGVIKKSDTIEYFKDFVVESVNMEFNYEPHNAVQVEPICETSKFGVTGGYATFDPSFVGGQFSLTGYKITKNEVVQTLSIHPDGKDDTIDNPIMTWRTITQYISKYYEYRHTLTFEYRGDPQVEPGDVKVFEYAPGQYVPCLVLSNNLHYEGFLRGKMIVKIMLTDEEIGQLPKVTEVEK